MPELHTLHKNTYVYAALVLIVLGGCVYALYQFEGGLLGRAPNYSGPQTFRVGETKTIEGLSVTPLKISEDSRCPSGVTCVWEGRVIASIKLNDGKTTKVGPMILGETVPFGDYSVTFTKVTPSKTQNKEIKDTDYRLTFLVKKTKTGADSSLKQYSNDVYGFSFSYPSNYYLDTKKEEEPGRTHLALVLTEDTAENKAVREGTSGPRDGPTSVAVDIYEDTLENPTLIEWLKETPASNFNLSNGKYENVTLAGQPAVKYTWDGLYRGDTEAISYRDYILAVSVTYLTPTDSTKNIFKTVTGTLKLK